MRPAAVSVMFEVVDTWDSDMRVRDRLKAWLGALIAPTLFLGLVAYFLWNATQGDRGLQAYALRQQHLASLQADMTRVQGDMREWDRRVAELRSQHVDPDMLDERARAMLNLVDPNDIVVPYGQNKRLFTPP